MQHIYDCLTKEELLNQVNIKGPVVELKLLGFFNAKDEYELPQYVYHIMLANQCIGKISLRLGFNQDVMITGHVGYEIESSYQGHNYAFYALLMIKKLAKAHGYDYILVTSEVDNEQSIHTLLKAGGRLLERDIIVPNQHIYTVLGKRRLNRYEIKL